MLAKLLEIRDLCPDVRHFVFEFPDLERFDFVPGQFVSIPAPIEGRTITRAYSIASAPLGNRFELCLNLVTSGRVSPYLFGLHPGDCIEVTGPHGGFILKDPPADSVLIATGTGIAPFRGMLRRRLPLDAAHSYTLLFGVRFEQRLFYRTEFEDLAARHSNFHFWPILSRPDPGWKGRAGHVQDHLLEALGARRDLDVYVCGLKLMVNDVRRILKEMGFERGRILYERYD
jgi:ferredoxin-NADP reductase